MDSTLLDSMLHILKASTGTIFLVGASLVLSTIFGALLTPLAVNAPRPVRMVLFAYSWLGRSLPPLTLLFGAYFGLSFAGVNVPSMTAAIIAFVFFSTAYILEIFRAAYGAVPRGQFEAAKAIGSPWYATQLKIIVPQVIRLASPAYITNATSVLKDSSLASVIGVTEVTAVTVRTVQSQPDSALLLFTFLGLVYLAFGSVLLFAGGRLEKRFSHA